MTNLEATNRALTFLGVPPIRELAEQTHTGRTVNRQFELTRLSVLSEYPWSFAIRFTRLNRLAVQPDDKDWMMAFSWPTGAVAIWDVFFSLNNSIRAKFLTESRLIYANRDGVSAEYSVDTPFLNWDDAAQEAFTYRLAADVAATLNRNEELSQAMMQKYIMFGTLAKRNTRNERNLDMIASGSYLRVRSRGGMHRKLNNDPGWRNT